MRKFKVEVKNNLGKIIWKEVMAESFPELMKATNTFRKPNKFKVEFSKTGYWYLDTSQQNYRIAKMKRGTCK